MKQQLLIPFVALILVSGCAQRQHSVNRPQTHNGFSNSVRNSAPIRLVSYDQEEESAASSDDKTAANDKSSSKNGEPNRIESLPKPPGVEPSVTGSLPYRTDIARLPSLGRTLSEFEQIALSNNPTLCQAMARIEAARGQCIQVGLLPNPVVGLSANEIGNEDAAGQYGLFVGKQHITNGKLGLRREVAQSEIQILEREAETQRLRVLTDVRIAFYDMLIEQRRVEVTEELERISREAVKTIDELVKNEEGTRVDLLQAEIEAETAQNNRQMATNDRDAAWRRLVSITGMPDDPVAAVQGELAQSLPEIHWDEAIARLRSQSPELSRAYAAVEKAKRSQQLACAEAVPNFNVQAGVSYDFASNDPFANLQFSRPIAIHNRNQGNIRSARADLSAAQCDIARTELDLQRRLAVVFQRYSNGTQQAGRYHDNILPKARETLELVYIGYRAGEEQYPYLSLLTAQRTLFNAELTYLKALREIWLANASVEGMLLQDSLVRR